MFLCEAALGKSKEITVDDSSLVKPPAGFDSIIAKGTQARTVDCLCRLVGFIFCIPPFRSTSQTRLPTSLGQRDG